MNGSASPPSPHGTGSWLPRGSDEVSKESVALFASPRKLLAAAWSTRRRAVGSAALLLALAGVAVYAGRTLWLEHHFRAAERAEERRDFAAARDHLEPYLAAYPDSGPAHFLAARNARRDGHPDEAVSHLEACRQMHYRPQDVDLERVLLKVQRGERLDDYLRERVEHNDPESVLILEVLADVYLRNYRLWDALWGLDRYLELRPADVKALVGRAFVWEKLNSFADAERDYRRALEIDPDNDAARLRFADLLLNRRGTPDQAAPEYERLRERDPDNPAYLLGVAGCRRKAGRLGEARQLLATLLRQHPHYPGALTEMGRVALDDGQPAEAIDWLHKAIQAAPTDRVAYSTLLNCLRLTGREQEERDCRVVLERLDADLKRIDELTRAALGRPYDPDLRCELGILFLRNGEEAEGRRWLGLALEQDPGHNGAHRALAEHFEAKGKPDLAAPHRRFVPKEP
jgi:Tfp pilus assembly protein PilF